MAHNIAKTAAVAAGLRAHLLQQRLPVSGREMLRLCRTRTQRQQQVRMSSNKTTAADAVIRVERATDFETVLDQSNQYAQIPRRAVIEVSGPDASEFLQGMQCNHMPTIDQGGGGMLTGFLTPQGRMLADAFVYPKNAGVNFPHPVFLVEVDEQAKDRMLKTLQFYKLRAKVRLCDVTDEYSVWSVWGPDSTALVGVVGQPLGHVPRGSLVFKGETTAAADVWLLDGRAPGMGLRLLLAAANNAEPSLPAGFERVAAERYTLRRVLKGVPEGACDFVAGVAVPLESNLDYMHGVHFNKGCYVGQELTIRTHHRGVVRKRIVPVIFAHTSDDASSLAVDQRFAQSQAPAPQADIVRVAESGESQPAEAAAPKVTRTRSRRVPPGKTGSTVFNAGLALMRLELVEQFVSQPADGCALRFETVAADGQRLAVLPWAPSWWPGNLEAQRQG